MDVRLGSATSETVLIETNQFQVVVNRTYKTTLTAFPSAGVLITVGGNGAFQTLGFGNALEKFSFQGGGDATNSWVNGVLSPTLGFAFNAVNTATNKKKVFAYSMKLTVYWTFPGGPQCEWMC